MIKSVNRLVMLDYQPLFMNLRVLQYLEKYGKIGI